MTEPLPPLPVALPFGLRNVQMLQYPTLAADTFGDTLVKLPNAQTFEFTEAEEYTDLRGDDALQASHGSGPQINWTLTNGGLSMEAYATIAGGEVVESGTEGERVRRYRKLVTDQRPYFVVIGQAVSDSGGDVHGVVWRARATGDIAGTFQDGEFYIPSATGIGFPCKVEGDLDGDEILNAVYDFAQHEEILAVVAPELDTPPE